MDKNIIIDGVNVSECEHINCCNNKIKCVILQDDVCETNPYCEGYNCYYKQLKQAENTVIECHKYLAELEDKIESLEQENKELRSALEEIRETLKKYDVEAGDTIIANPIQDCYNTYCKINEALNLS